MLVIIALNVVFYTFVGCQRTTTLSPEDLHIKLTYGINFGQPFDHQIPEEATTPYLVETRDGYPFEEYGVTTEDGYVLGLQRIPYSKNLGNKSSKKPVVFLMHGLLCSSSVFVVNGPNVSLAYELSDRGYDVYMGNARGNSYSKKHTNLSPNDPEFWIFDWHEIALYDIPAMINFALETSKANNLQYIGHSQGGTVYLVLNSLKPEFHSKIISGHLLAAGCFLGNLRSPVFKAISPILGQPNEYASQAGFGVLPTAETIDLVGHQRCLDESEDKSICRNLLFLITGYHTRNLVQSRLPEILKSLPNDAAFRQVLHFAQLVNTSLFNQFDFGEEQNLQRYGSPDPPDYPLGKIEVPSYFYTSNNDIIIVTEDIDKCAAEMSPKVVKAKRVMPLETFAHMDFVWGNATVLNENLYGDLFKDLRQARGVNQRHKDL